MHRKCNPTTTTWECASRHHFLSHTFRSWTCRQVIAQGRGCNWQGNFFSDTVLPTRSFLWRNHGCVSVELTESTVFILVWLGQPRLPCHICWSSKNNNVIRNINVHEAWIQYEAALLLGNSKNVSTPATACTCARRKCTPGRFTLPVHTTR